MDRSLAIIAPALLALIHGSFGNEGGHHLGYVPRAKSEEPARLMDAGKLLIAKFESTTGQSE